MKKILTTLAITAAILGGSAACSQTHDDTHGIGDAGVTDGYGHRKGNDAPKLVTNFPDGFANVATGCVAPGFRAFVTTASVSTGRITVLADASCNNYTGGEALYR